MFPCDKCGECCKNLRYSNLYSDLDRGDGICKYLENNLCLIYNERPILCRIDEGYELVKEKMTLEEYYQLNEKACVFLKFNKGEK